MTLDPIQLRVLGALIEKEITTPENYPLSLNALIAASNQRSSRDPVLDLTEDDVRQALHSLEDLDIVASVRDARVPKYEHRIRTVLNLRRDETALLCLLLLRGPQTPGELRARADRMFPFDDIAAVQSTLERLASRGSSAASDTGSTSSGEPATPLVVMLPRQPGSRESRYAHLMCEPVATTTHSSHPVRREDVSPGEAVQSGLAIMGRLRELEEMVLQLEARVDALEAAQR
jgi:uncharacterized protein YceH (UPF0502 family)